MINDKYAKLIQLTNGYELEFAPLLNENADDKDYLKIGYKKIINNFPADIDENEYYIYQDGYAETSASLSAIYKITKKQNNKKYIISKYKLIAALMKKNIWTQVKQLLEDNNLLDLFNAAQVLDSEDEFFKQGIQLVKTELEITDEDIQSILDAILE